MIQLIMITMIMIMLIVMFSTRPAARPYGEPTSCYIGAPNWLPRTARRTFIPYPPQYIYIYIYVLILPLPLLLLLIIMIIMNGNETKVKSLIKENPVYK